MLNIYSDRKYLPSDRDHVVMLYPFWGSNPEVPGAPNNGRFERYRLNGDRCFTVTPLQQADVAVFPAEWIAGDQNQLAAELAQAARCFGKPTVIFFNSDSDERIEIDHAMVFQTSLYRSTRRSNEFGLPAWSEDFLERYQGGHLRVRKWRSKPVVGYCGYAAQGKSRYTVQLVHRLYQIPLLSERLSSLPIQSIRNPGYRIRSKAIEALSRSERVETNFIIRRAFWAGAMHEGKLDINAAQSARQEFVQNIVGSDYVLCTRGAGNFSYRLYETLSCGRIPVLVDTDCVLPYENLIDWSHLCVWVDEKDLGDIDAKVSAFHNGLSPRDFEDLQRLSRQVWESWLSPLGFFSKFDRHF